MTDVSVVIPTYERPEFLDGAIETALGQTYNSVAVVVVDDGSSTDYAQQVVANYSERVRCVSHAENRGLSAARNTGIEAASGDCIAFLDDDDRWHRTKIERQIDALERDPSAGLATCLTVSITPDGEVMRCEPGRPSGDLADRTLISNVIGTPSRVLVRGECFDDVGTFDESLSTKQDWDLYLRLCQRWTVALVDDHLCFRTVHESMSSDPAAGERDNQKILQKHEDAIKRRGNWNRALADYHEQIGRAYLHSGNPVRAREHLSAGLDRQVTAWKALLFASSFTTPGVFRTAVALKRKVESFRNDCTRISISPETVPGV
jgi:glycosyltransferase involved in cell wall biosynthesis